MTSNQDGYLDDHPDHSKPKKSVNVYHGENPENIVFEGGTTGEPPTTIKDTMNFSESDRGDDGIRTSSPTENTPESEEEMETDQPDALSEPDPLNPDFLGTNDPRHRAMEGEGMGGHNFGNDVHPPFGNDIDNPSRNAGNNNAYFKEEPSEENAGSDDLKD